MNGTVKVPFPYYSNSEIKIDVISDTNSHKNIYMWCINPIIKFIIVLYQILESLIILGTSFFASVYTGKSFLYLYCSVRCGSLSHQYIEDCDCYNVSKHNFWYYYDSCIREFFIGVIVIILIYSVVNCAYFCICKCKSKYCITSN